MQQRKECEEAVGGSDVDDIFASQVVDMEELVDEPVLVYELLRQRLDLGSLQLEVLVAAQDDAAVLENLDL